MEAKSKQAFDMYVYNVLLHQFLKEVNIEHLLYSTWLHWNTSYSIHTDYNIAKLLASYPSYKTEFKTVLAFHI